jgi:O-antigen/teichoic acid export membrane protein
MVNLRRAIMWASAGQYLVIAINVISVVLLARLVTPAEYGVSLLGGAVLSVAEAIREIAGSAYLVREQEFPNEKMHSTTTMSAMVTILVTALLLLTAGPLATFFCKPMLTSYLGIAVFGYALGPLIHPQMALLSRGLAFKRLAVINLLQAFVGASIAIPLALLNFGALSFAWAGNVSALAAAILCLAIGPGLSNYRPSLKYWRNIISFGAYSSATAILGKISETLPVFILGKFLSAEAVAIAQRAAALSLFPERVVLAAVGSVALPEFSRRAREGEDLKATYLTALSYMSVVQWPAIALLAILAEPTVLFLLGRQWGDVVPLLRILSPALMFTVPVGLQYAVLIAAGAVGRLPRLLVLQMVVLSATLLVSARFGLSSMAWSMYVAMPIVAGLSLIAVRNTIGFRWRMLWTGACLSAVVTVITVVAPLTIALYASSSPMSLISAALVGSLGAGGWIFGLYVTGHPFWGEVCRPVSILARRLG